MKWEGLPSYERRVLANGMTLLLARKASVPLVSFDLLLSGGSCADPPGHEGLAFLTISLLRKGTRAHDARAFSSTLDSLGALFGTTLDHDWGHVGAEFLSADAMRGVELIAEAVLAPSFPEEEVLKQRRLIVDGIASNKDYPPSVLGRYFDRALFGGHPYGRPVGGEERSVGAIERDEIVAFHRAVFDPSRFVMSVVGDLDPDRMAGELERAFAGSGNGGAPRPPAPAAPAPIDGRRVLLVDMPSEASCYFRFGNVGVAFDDPDWIPIRLACTVLGGQFTSWLNRSLRIDSGLTYGVHAAFSRRRRPGAFFISSFTPVEHAERAIELARAELNRLHEGGINAAELRAAKNYLKGQFPLSVESSDQIAQTIAILEGHGMDRAYLDSYLDRIEEATTASVAEATRRAFPRDDLLFTLIGPANQLAPLAEKLGPVTHKRIDEPGF